MSGKAQKALDLPYWEQAVADAQELIKQSRDSDEKERLECAIEWFKNRIAKNAPAPS